MRRLVLVVLIACLPGAAALAQAPQPRLDGSLIQVRPSGSPQGLSLRTLSQQAADILQGADYGLVCDGATDTGPALQRLLDAVSPRGSGLVQLPAGECIIDTPVTISKTVTLRGHGRAEVPTLAAIGTTLRTTKPGIIPVTILGLAASGTGIEHLAFSQHHPVPAPGWTPTDYQPFFRLESVSGVRFRNLLGFAVKRGITANSSGRLDVDGLWGQFFDYALRIDNSLDVDRYRNLHFWPFWTTADPVLAYQQANMDAVRLARVDNPIISDLFVFAARSGLRIEQSTSNIGGSVSKLKLAAADLDYVRYGVWIQGAGVTMQAANLSHQGSSWPNGTVPLTDAAVLRVDTTGSADVQLGNVQSDVAHRNVIAVLNATARTQVQIGSLLVKQIAGGVGSAVFRLEPVPPPGLPHYVSVANAPILAPTAPLPMLAIGTNARMSVPEHDYQIVYGITPGATYKVPNSVSKLILEPAVAGPVTSLVIAMPDNASEGVEATVVVTQDVTAVTVTSPEPVVAPPSSLQAGVGFTMKRARDANGIAWVRIR